MIHDSAPHVQFRAHAILCQSRIVAEDYGNGGITMFFFVLSHFEVLGFARKNFYWVKGFFV